MKLHTFKTFEDTNSAELQGLIGHEVYYCENDNENEEIESFNGQIAKIHQNHISSPNKNWFWLEIEVTELHQIIDEEKHTATVGEKFKVLAKRENLQELIDKGKTAIVKNERHGAYRWITLDN